MSPKTQLDSPSSPAGVEPSQANSETGLKTIKNGEFGSSKQLSSPNPPTKANAEASSVSKPSSASTTSPKPNNNDPPQPNDLSSQNLVSDISSVSQVSAQPPQTRDISQTDSKIAPQIEDVVQAYQAPTERHRGSGNIQQYPPTRRPQSPSWTTNLWAKLKQHATLLLFTIFALVVLGCSTWLVYTEFISLQQVPLHLQLSPGNTITVVNILSHVNMFLVVNLFEPVLGAFRKSIATRDQGVLSTTFLAMCTTMTITETGPLLRVRGWHQLLYISRLLFKAILFFLGVILLINPIHTTIYNQGSNIATIPVVAGLAQLNVNVLTTIPISVVDVYYQTFIKGILMDSSLVIGIDPVTCSGADCTSILLPGGLDLVRLAGGGPNSTLYGNQPPDALPVAMIYQAPAYHFEYFPITDGFLFNKSTDCQTYGGVSNEALHIFIAANNTQILAGWSVCPSDLFYSGLCFNATTWTDQLDETTTLAIYKRYATVAYDLKNFSILSIEWISDPEPTSPNVIREIVSNLTFTFSHALSSVPSALNTTDPNFPTEAGTFCVEWDLGWALRLYEDDYKNYAGGPLSVLQAFLTVPIQFSTTGWQAVSWDTLPQDLYTTASFATSAPRALGRPWVIIVFSAGVGLIELLALSMLLSVIIRERLFPQDLNWSMVNDHARRRIMRLAQGETLMDETVSLTNADGNDEQRIFNATFREKTIYIEELPPGV